MAKRKPTAQPANPWKERVLRLMSRYSLTQTAIGQRLGVSQPNVAAWIAGTRVPPKCVQKLMLLMEHGNDLGNLE